MKPTKKQLRQRKLSFALKICRGFQVAAKRLIPDDILSKANLISWIDCVIIDLYYELDNIE